jgi:hypothetical protein
MMNNMQRRAQVRLLRNLKAVGYQVADLVEELGGFDDLGVDWQEIITGIALVKGDLDIAEDLLKNLLTAIESDKGVSP